MRATLHKGNPAFCKFCFIIFKSLKKNCRSKCRLIEFSLSLTFPNCQGDDSIVSATEPSAGKLLIRQECRDTLFPTHIDLTLDT